MPKKINVKRWLTDRQLRLYDYNTRQGDHYKDIDIVQALKALAECRRLMTDHPPDVITIEEYEKWQQAIDTGRK